MTLSKKVQELQAINPPLDVGEINRRLQEWKATQSIVEETVEIEGNSNDLPLTDAVVDQENVASENTDLQSTDGSLVSLNLDSNVNLIEDEYLTLGADIIYAPNTNNGRGLMQQGLQSIVNNMEDFNGNVTELNYFTRPPTPTDADGNVSFIDPNYVAGDQNPAQFGKTEGMYPGGIDAELTILDDGTSSFKRQEYDPLKSLGGLLGLFTGGGFQDDYDNYEDTYTNYDALYDSETFNFLGIGALPKDQIGTNPVSQVVLNYSNNFRGNTTKNNLLEVSVQNIRKRYENEQTNLTINNELKTTTLPELINKTIEYGKIFNSPEENERTRLQKKLDSMPDGVAPTEEENKVEFEGEDISKFYRKGGDDAYWAKEDVRRQIREIEEDENLGDKKLYDEETGKVIAFDKASTKLIESYAKSKDIAETTEIDVIKGDVTKAYYKVVALSRFDITNEKDFRRSLGRADYLLDATSKVRQYSDEDAIGFNLEQDLKFIASIAKTGIIPEKISKLAGNHPFSIAFNEALEEYIVLNRAYQTNTNPISTEKEGFIGSLIVSLNENLSLESGGKDSGGATKNVRTFSDLMFQNGQINILPEEWNERLESNISQMAGGGIIDLASFAAQIYLTKKVSGGLINKYYKTLQKMAQGSSLYGKSRVYASAFEIGLKGLEESATFVLNDLIWNDATDEELMATSMFAWNLGFGQGVAGQILKYTPVSRFMSPLIAKMNKSQTLKGWPQSIIGSTTGAASFEFASYRQDSGEFMMKKNADGTFTAKTKMDHAKHFLAEYYKMRIMGGKSIFQKNGMLRAFRNDIRAMRGLTSVELRDAAKDFGLTDTEEIKKPKENTVNDLNESRLSKLEDIAAEQEAGNITAKEAQERIKKLNENYEILSSEAELNIAKEQIKLEDNSNFRITDAQVYVAIERLKKGLKLDAKDNYVLANAPKPLLLNAFGKGSKNTSEFIDGQIGRASVIEQILDSHPDFKTAFVDGKPSKTRKETFDFINKSFELGGEIKVLEDSMKNAVNGTAENIEKLKVLKEQYKQYEKGGSIYNEIIGKIQAERRKLFDEDALDEKGYERPQEIITSKKGFKDKYNELFPDKPKGNLENSLAFFDPNTNIRYINEVAAIEQGATATSTHERTHYAFVDAYKGKDGLITDKGIKIIDDVLDRLTPDQRKLLEEEVNARYSDLIETGKKGLYYEEYLAVLAELNKEGRISFKQGAREKLKDLLNLDKSNLKVNLESGENIFEVVTEKGGLNRVEGLSRKGGDTGVKFSNAKANELANNKERTREEELALKNQYTALALEALGFKEGLGTAKRKEAVSFVDQYYTGILRRFKPGTTMFSTFVNANIRPKKQKFYEQEIGTKGVETRISDERAKEIEAEENAPISTEAEVVGVKLVDILKVNKAPLDVIFKDKVKELVADQLKDLNVKDEKFRSEAFKPNKEFINYIKQNLLGKSITDYKKFIRENPNFIKGLNIKALLEFDKGRTKEGKPRLFTELNRELTKQKDIEKFMMQGRVPYLTVEQIKQGANLYDRLKPTETQIVNFLTGGSASTISNRKTALAREIANKFIAEATPSTEAFKEMTTAERAKVGEKLQVDPNAKFSNEKKGIAVTLKEVVEDSEAMESWRNKKPKKQEGEDDKSYNDKLEEWSKKRPGAFDLKTVGGRERAVKIAMDLSSNGFFQKIFDAYGEAAYLILGTATWAPSGNKASAVYKRGQLFINNPKMAGAQVKDPVERAKIIAEIEALVNEGLVGEFDKIRKRLTEIEKEGNLKKQKGIENMKVATGPQGIANVPNNIANRSQHIKGSQDLLKLAKEVYDKDASTLPMLEKLFYNSSANFAFYRKLAQIIDIEELAKGDKIKTEEHLYQAGNWAIRTLRAITSKVPGNFEKWNKLQAEDLYWQIAIGKKSQLIIDKTYSKSRFEVNGKFKDLPLLDSKSQEHPVMKEGIDFFEKTGDISKIPDARIRAYNDYYTLNPFRLGKLGIKDALDYNVMVPKKYWDNQSVINEAGKLIYEQIMTKIGAEGFSTTAKQARERMDSFMKVEPGKEVAMFSNSKIFGKKLKDAKTVKEQIEILKNYDTAAEMARRLNAPVKKIRVFDFDDTLARSKSKVLYELPDGKTGSLSATEYAKRSEELEAKDAIFDFSEFNKVIDGKKGPLFELAKKIQDSRGSEDIFVLTARPQESATAIKEFLDALGLNLPIENITGLENGSPSAKANWIAGKAAKGYNDFYFADDMMKNVTAVKDVLDQIDVKGVVQQAKFSKEKNFDKIFNQIIESSTGIETFKEFSAAKAKTIGEKKGRFTFFTTPSAEDFLGLLYKTLGKGKIGDAQLDFYKTNLIDTYDRAELGVTEAKITAARSFKALKSKLKSLPKSLSKQTGIGGFTFSQAVRVSVWTKQGMKVPGLSKTDIKELNKFVDDNAELTTFTNELINIQKGKAYPEPGKEWLGGTITTDIIGEINKVNRKEYLQEWQENVDILFSDKNLNKLEAAYGSRYRESLEESLYRMKTGSNRPVGGSRIVNEMMDWLNNSVGAIMFLNTRSAVLQTISSVNFINWENNNILKAGKAFANQPQYWKDFKTLMNSPYLLERREGLKINVSESEIADAVMQSKNKVTGAINYLLNKGFIFTRIADSFAIASGGSTYYRNQIEAYVKNGMSKEAAEKQAYEDFYAIAETNQQSSNPSKISQQQASAAGRVILAFGNTPMQYNRIIKKATQDLVNRRGDWKSNLTKIVYYAGMQNFIFNALQNALFAEAFGEDEEESTTMADKQARIADGMTDSLLRGIGIQGAAVAAVKDALVTIYKENSKEKGTPKYEKAIDDLLGFSPPISSKIRKVRGGLRTISWNQKEIQKEGFNLNNPAYLAGANIVEGFTNVPSGRAIKKINNIRNIFSDNSEAWQKVALTMGWSTWDVGLPYYGLEGEGKEQTPVKVFENKIDELKKTTTGKQQKERLLELGVSRSELKKYKYEEDRVKKILQLEKEYKDNPKKKDSLVKVNKRKTVIFAENKSAQVTTLLGLGLSKEDIKKLKYEKDRVDKIIELQNKK